MTHMTTNIQALNELEEDFEATVRDVRFKNRNKFNLLSNIIDNMADILIIARKKGDSDVHDLAEFMNDFLLRNDLGPTLICAAFNGARKDELEVKLQAHMDKRSELADAYLRPQEHFRLEPK